MSTDLGSGHSVRAVTAAVTASLVVASVLLAASTARAGYWMRSTCVNPNGTAAPSEGWSGMAGGGTGFGSNNSAGCGPHMFGLLSTAAAVPVGAYEGVVYVPPEGSTLSGGIVGVNLLADGGGVNASGVAAVFSPSYAYDASNVVFQCASGLSPCSGATNNYVGPVGMPSGRGGNLYVVATCGGNAGWTCNARGSQGAWSRVVVYYANILLASTQTPTASDFRGTLLEPGAHGTAGLSFAASVPSGPGIYKVTVWIDDKAVYDAMPNSNTGKCIPVGSDRDTGALFFAYQQPCLRAQTIDVQVRTASLRDGEHQLRVAITDAAQNTQTVLRRTITTNNRTTANSTLTSDPPAAGSPGAAPGQPAYALVLDAPTRRLARGVRRGWRRSGIQLSGTLVSNAGTPAPGIAVSLFARHAGRAETEVLARAVTDASGRWTLTATRGPSRFLTITYGAQAPPAGPSAVTIRQTVVPALSLTAAAPGHTRLRFRGRFTGRPLGSPRPLIVIEVRRGRRWQAVGQPVRVSESGGYTQTYEGGHAVVGRSYAFRAKAPATSLFATGISPIRRAMVR